ncbi:MAG: Hpt domain-containing protein [Cephaloticoccus sp.]|nr:Hpt domain-containing protein [Cephaloticoccus sp.]
MPETPIIDPEAIENLRSLNPGDNDEFLREIVGIFLEDTPKRLTELNECLARHDVRSFTRAAHSIKGSSANVGAGYLRRAAEQLEHKSNADGLVDVAAQITEVRNRFIEAKAELERIAGL